MIDKPVSLTDILKVSTWFLSSLFSQSSPEKQESKNSCFLDCITDFVQNFHLNLQQSSLVLTFCLRYFSLRNLFLLNKHFFSHRKHFSKHLCVMLHNEFWLLFDITKSQLCNYLYSAVIEGIEKKKKAQSPLCICSWYT